MMHEAPPNGDTGLYGAERSARPVTVLHVLGRLNRGGTESRTLEVTRELQRTAPYVRSEICVLSGMPGDLDEQFEAMGAVIHYLRLGPGFAPAFILLLRRRSIDIVHAHVHYSSGVFLALASAVRVKKRIAHFRSAADGRTESTRRRFQRSMTRRLIALFATDILAVSESTMLDAWGPSYQTDKRCRVLYNGFDLERFRTGSDAREAVRQGIGVGSDDLLLIHVGNQVAAKNHDKLIRVFVELAQSDERWRLVLIGRSDPEIQERLDHLIGLKGLGDKVSFLGVRQDVPELLSAADVMVHPSIREGFPGAILEGVAAGLPVVASDIPQNREVVMLGAAVSAVSLSEPDSTWAHVTRQIALQPQSSFEDRARWFSSHGLTTEDAVRRLLDVWLAESG